MKAIKVYFTTNFIMTIYIYFNNDDNDKTD